MSDLQGLIGVLKVLSEVGAKFVAVLEAPTAEAYAAALIPAAVSLKHPIVDGLPAEAKAAVKSALEALVAAAYPAASDEVEAAKVIEGHLEAIMQYAPVVVIPEPVEPEPTPVEPEPAPVEPEPVEG